MAAATPRRAVTPLEKSRHRSLHALMGLFEAPKEKLEGVAHEIFASDATLFDPNNGGEFRGTNALLAYIARIRNAFGGQVRVDLREITLDNDKARATYVLHGTYRGSAHVQARLAQPAPVKPRMVSFAIVVTVTFKPDTGLIQNILCAWDALGLMRQIGLVATAPSSSSSSSTSQPSKRARLGGASSSSSSSATAAPLSPPPPSLSPDQIRALHNQRIESLARMFSASPLDRIPVLAESVLHPNCRFQDSYMGGEFRGLASCVKYTQRVRGPFPALNVVSVKRSENEGRALGSPLRLDWVVRAVYAGPLVKKRTDCGFNAILFVTFDDESHLIDSVHFSWSVHELMKELGVLRAGA